MDPGEGPSDPFRRSGRIMRSPTQRSLSVPDVMSETEAETLTQGKKRKERTTPPAVTSKRRQVGEETEEDEERDSDVELMEAGRTADQDFRGKFKGIKRICSDLVRWATSQYKSKKINNLQLGEVKTKVADISELLEGLERETHFMAGRLTERIDLQEKIVEAIEGVDRPVAGRPLSFADVAKVAKVPRVTGIAKVHAPKVLFVRSEGDRQDVDEVKDLIKRTVRPSKLGINIKRVVKTARGVMIETENQDQLDKFKNCPELNDKGLIFDKPRKKNPRLMIYDVDSPEDENEMVEDIYDQNVNKDFIDLPTFKQEFKIVHKYKKRDQKDTRVALVVDCTARVRNEIRRRDRVYVGWQSCRLKDYNPLVRCFKCQQYGHVAKYCRNKNVCPHCAEQHEEAACRNKNRPPKCPNCLTARRDPNHSLTDAKCPEYARATKIAYEKVDYGT